MNVEFTFTLEIEAILIVEYITRSNPNLESTPYADNLLKPASFTSVNDAVYTITVGIIQREEKILATMSQEQEKGGPRDDHIGGDPRNGLHQSIEKENPPEVPYIFPDKDLDTPDGDPNTLEGDEAFEKPSIALVSSTLSIKISENALYIVIKVGIRIYSKDFRKT